MSANPQALPSPTWEHRLSIMLDLLRPSPRASSATNIGAAGYAKSELLKMAQDADAWLEHQREQAAYFNEGKPG